MSPWVDGAIVLKCEARIAALEAENARLRAAYDGYGVALLGISFGVTDPKGVALDALNKYGTAALKPATDTGKE